jgi:hypothetical protein
VKFAHGVGLQPSASGHQHFETEGQKRLKMLRKSICDRVVAEQEMMCSVCADEEFLDQQDPSDLVDMAAVLEDGSIRGPFDEVDSASGESDGYPDPTVDADSMLSLDAGVEAVSAPPVPIGASASGSSSSSSAPPVLGPTHCPNGTDMTDPSTLKHAEGYMRRADGPSLARVQIMVRANTTSYRCYQHSGCTLVAYGRFPIPLPEVKKWIASAEVCVAGEGKVVSSAKGKRHLDKLKELRSTCAPRG